MSEVAPPCQGRACRKRKKDNDGRRDGDEDDVKVTMSLEMKASLHKFNNEADRALQRLLWAIGCKYTLLPHQPEAVRSAAGLPPCFPYSSPNNGSVDISNPMSI